MTVWREPRWHPDWLTPERLHARGGFVMSAAEVARRGTTAARSWDDRLPGVEAGDAWILVGGAGMLGAWIAAALLHEGGTTPVVIVARRPERVCGRWAAMVGADLAARMMRDPRLRLVAADVTSGDLGWTRRLPGAGVVVHISAAMHGWAGWDRLSAVNVDGLRGSVALARRDGALLQLASTLSVFVSSNAARADGAAVLPAADDLWLHGGYAQTKAAAEHGLAVAGLARWQVVRFGLLIPEAGRGFADDHFAPVFGDALRRVGVPDRAERAFVDLTPVGAAAAMAIRMARAGGPRFVHVAAPVAGSLEAMIAAFRAAGHDLPVVATADWRARVDALPAIPRALLRAAFEKTRFLESDAARAPLLNMDLFQSTHRRFVIESGPGAVPGASMAAMVASMTGGTERA